MYGQLHVINISEMQKLAIFIKKMYGQVRVINISEMQNWPYS